MKFTKLLKPLWLLTLCAMALPPLASTEVLQVSPEQIFQVDLGYKQPVTCTQVGDTWRPGHLRSDGISFVPYHSKLKRLQSRIRRASSESSKRLKKRRQRLKKKFRAGKEACKGGPESTPPGDGGGGDENGDDDDNGGGDGLVKNPKEKPCPGFEDVGLYAVPNYAGDFVCPGDSAQIVFVSSTDGDDENSGLSAGAPVQTLEKAKSFLRSDEADWIVAKRGDVWGKGFGVWNSSGKDETNRDVLTAYGDSSLHRPTLHTENDNATGMSIWPSSGASALRHLTISGIQLTAVAGHGGSGIRMLGNTEDVVVHDTRVSFYKVGMVFQGTDGGHHNKLAVVGNTLDHNAPTGSGHSQGLFAYATCKMIVRDNKVINNGYTTRDDPETGATTFNQGLYFQADQCEVEEFIGNQVRGNAAAGVQFRSGVKNAELNLFSRNGSQIVIANGTLPEYQGSYSTLQKNVLVEGSYLQSAENPGALAKVGMYSRGGLYVASDNVFSDMIKHIEGSICNEAYRRGLCNMNFQDNFFVNGKSHPETESISKISAPGLLDEDFVEAVFSGNTFYMPHLFESAGSAPETFFTFANELDGQVLPSAGLSFSNNRYIHGDIANSGTDFFRAFGSGLNLQEWKAGNGGSVGAIEPSALALTQLSLPDPCRTVATYVDDVIDGNLENDNCAIMNDDSLYNRFDEGALQLQRFSSAEMKEKYGALAVINYIRAGLSLPAFDAPANPYENVVP